MRCATILHMRAHLSSRYVYPELNYSICCQIKNGAKGDTGECSDAIAAYEKALSILRAKTQYGMAAHILTA